MEQTGHDLPSLYKETSLGGLATMGLHGRDNE
jgi:L-serine deaminase